MIGGCNMAKNTCVKCVMESLVMVFCQTFHGIWDGAGPCNCLDHTLHYDPKG